MILETRPAKWVVKAKVHFRRLDHGRKTLKTGMKPTPISEGNVPRVSRLLALAIRYDRLIREGRIRDYAEIARLGRLTRARVTQIMMLLNLAPDIQEQVLHMPVIVRGRDFIVERQLRKIAGIPCWVSQRKSWGSLIRSKSS